MSAAQNVVAANPPTMQPTTTIARSSEDDEGQGNDDVPDVGLTALVGDNLNCGACVGCRHVTQRLGVCTRKSA